MPLKSAAQSMLPFPATIIPRMRLEMSFGSRLLGRGRFWRLGFCEANLNVEGLWEKVVLIRPSASTCIPPRIAPVMGLVLPIYVDNSFLRFEKSAITL